MSRTRQGKIARLPHKLREEINRRLLNGETGGVILAWLNVQPEALQVYDDGFEGAPATAQNLSEWRLGGYRDWLTQREKVEALKSLSAHAAELAAAGGGVESGVSSLLAGHIMESWESLIYGAGDEAGDSPPNLAENFSKIAAAASRLKKVSLDEQKLELEKRKLKQRDRILELDREKFETQTVAKFLEWAKRPEAAAILDSGKPQPVQMELMRELMFGKAT